MHQFSATVALALGAASCASAAQVRGPRADPSEWPAAVAKASALVSRMTAEEQNNITYGIPLTNGCSGISGAASRLGFPGLCLTDGPAGIKSDLVTGYAGGVSVAASFNEDLSYERGLYMGMEFKKKGSHVANGPVVGPMGRIALDGRAWEGFGNDPYLSGKLAAANIQGMQQSVITAVKHFIGNEQETQRNPSPSGNVSAISADIDDATMHELYLWPFQDAVHAGTAAVMSSYNRLNGTYASENHKTQTELLKGELAFPGFIVSDWGAQHSGAASANGGLDMAMPSSSFWEKGALAKAVQNGQVAKERLADMAKRILSAWYHVISSDFPAGGSGLPADLTSRHTLVDARNKSSKPSTRQSAVEGHVLVKNVKNALPLKKPQVLSLYGYDATIPQLNYPASSPLSFYSYGIESYNVTFQQAAQALVGQFAGSPPQIASLGTIIGGGGSGATLSSLWSDPWSAIQRQAEEDDTAVYWDFTASESPTVALTSDACLVFLNAFASETFDRAGLYDKESDNLVQAVAKQCANTIVVMHNAWIRLVDIWIEHPNVTAVVYAHLPGQYSGDALVDILYGRVSPSGRLPYTVAKSWTDYGQLLGPTKPANGNPHTNFTEGTHTDYRWFQYHNITPRYPFGYGLTYSSFGYSGVSAAWTNGAPAITPPNPNTVIPGGIASLFDQVATVKATVTNTGKVEAAEVPQLYIQFPNEPVTHLRGFQKPVLKPGESAEVTFPLTRRDLSRWNVATQGWELRKGTYNVVVGKDSFDSAALKCSLVSS